MKRRSEIRDRLDLFSFSLSLSLSLSLFHAIFREDEHDDVCIFGKVYKSTRKTFPKIFTRHGN